MPRLFILGTLVQALEALATCVVLNEIMAQVLQIFVRTLSGKTLPLEVEGYNTVASAKRGKVEEEARHPRHRQHLVCDGTELPDDKALLLEHCHEKNRSMLHHYLCLREAMQVLVRSPYCKTMYVEEWVGDIIISQGKEKNAAESKSPTRPAVSHLRQ